MMPRIATNTIRTIILAAIGAVVLSACATSQPDQVAVQELPPLVLPPDFALKPVLPGDPRPAQGTRMNKTLNFLMGDPSPRSEFEADIIDRAGRSVPGIRSSVGDIKTHTVAKGRITRNILAAPEGDGRAARVFIEG